MDIKHSTAFALIVGLGLALPTFAQEAAQAAEADVDGNGFVSGEEAAAHDERRFETLAEGAGEMTLEQFRAGLLGAEVVGTEAEAEPVLEQDTEFGAADLDQNGTLNREEWLQWRQQRFLQAAGAEGQVETGLYVSIDAGGAMAGVDEGGEPLAEEAEPDTDPPAEEVNRVETDPDATTDPVAAPETDPAATSDPAVEPDADAATDPAGAPETDPTATSDPAVEPDPDATTDPAVAPEADPAANSDPAVAPETDPDATTDPAGASEGGDPATEEGQTFAPLERPAESATNETPADAEVSVWTGVYTEAQAERGKEIYSGLCSSCHGSRLDGAADDPDAQSAPPLARAKFLTKWNGSTLEGLFQYTKITMPVSNPGFLSDQEYVDIIAHMLASSNMPVGGTELPADPAALAGIIIEEQRP